MAYAGNSPQQETVIQLEARKSFSFAIYVQDSYRRPCDLTNAQLSLVVKAQPQSSTDVADSDNLISSSFASIMEPLSGYARFNIQARELDLAEGEYPFAIVLRSAQGYTSVIIKGVIAIAANTEFASISSQYDGVQPPQSLTAVLMNGTAFNVFAGQVVPPGMNWLTDIDQSKLDKLNVDAIAQMPAGGHPGEVLSKFSVDDYSYDWVPMASLSGALDATGVPEGMIPTASGTDVWQWMSPAALQADWNAIAGPSSILNKPTLGTAAAANVEDFAPAVHDHDASDITSGVMDPARLPKVTGLTGITSGTVAPTGGAPGDLYLQIL